jgi:hypothetical protein
MSVFQKVIASVFITALMAAGQTSPNEGGVSIAIFPPPPAAFEELKTYLALTDGQVEQLRKLLEEKSGAAQQIYQRIREKQVELNNLLQAGSRDVSRIGQLTLDIHLLIAQPPAPSDQWRQRALAILTPDQRTKLTGLDQALKLSTPGYQAMTLNLLDPPPPGRPIILERPMPVDFGGSIGNVVPTLPAPGTPVPLPTPLSVGAGRSVILR